VKSEASFTVSALSNPAFAPTNASASAQPLPESGLHMMEELLPPEVVSVEAWNDDRSAVLYPEERAQLGNAVESRLQEFASARSLARQALGLLGLPPVPILRGALGEPLWPFGIVGTITHCTGYRAAAVARSAHLRSLGIDAEIDDALPPEVVGSVLLPEEIAWIENAPDRGHWDRILFSAKESVYKAWFSLTHRWLGFEDVSVTIDPASGTFHADLHLEPPLIDGQFPTRFAGRFLICRGFILTSVVVARKGLTTWPQIK
jgi:4'-phosphopantetheinyl transferase EntD